MRAEWTLRSMTIRTPSRTSSAMPPARRCASVRNDLCLRSMFSCGAELRVGCFRRVVASRGPVVRPVLGRVPQAAAGHCAHRLRPDPTPQRPVRPAPFSLSPCVLPKTKDDDGVWLQGSGPPSIRHGAARCRPGRQQAPISRGGCPSREGTEHLSPISLAIRIIS